MPNSIRTALRALATLAAVSLCVPAAANESKLVSIHEDIVADYADVEHLPAQDLLTLASDRRVVFDVREPDEYAVSHIDGAIQVDPDISVEAFTERYAALLEDRTVVFYCSVGRRSSILAQRLDSAVVEHGATATYNLIGGIFQWRNENRPLVDGDGQTSAVHPYNRFWGRLIEDKKAIEYE